VKRSIQVPAQGKLREGCRCFAELILSLELRSFTEFTLSLREMLHFVQDDERRVQDDERRAQNDNEAQDDEVLLTQNV
jgi:hypothetical protein